MNTYFKQIIILASLMYGYSIKGSETSTCKKGCSKEVLPAKLVAEGPYRTPSVALQDDKLLQAIAHATRLPLVLVALIAHYFYYLSNI